MDRSPLFPGTSDLLPFTIFREALLPTALMRSTSLHRRLDIEFNHQSQPIAFSEWLSMLTLCFAPLAAHLLVGVPEPTVCAVNSHSLGRKGSAISTLRRYSGDTSQLQIDVLVLRNGIVLMIWVRLMRHSGTGNVGMGLWRKWLG
jgi:hypothetical protein